MAVKRAATRSASKGKAKTLFVVNPVQSSSTSDHRDILRSGTPRGFYCEKCGLQMNDPARLVLNGAGKLVSSPCKGKRA